MNNASSDDLDMEPNFAAQMVMYLKGLYQEYYEGRQDSRDADQQKMDEIAEVIQTYRGVAEEEESEENCHWVDRAAFDVLMCFIIILNTIVIGLEIDIDGDSQKRGAIWVLFEIFFVVAFGLEIFFKVREHTRKWVIQTPMNFISTCIAVVAAIDLGLFYPLREAGVIRIKGVLRMITLCRIVGLLRLVRVVQHYKSLAELRLTLQGLGQSFQSIVWVCFCAMIFLYVNALLTTTAVGQNIEVYGRYRKLSGGWDHEVMFGSVPRSMYTLLQVMTLEGWSSKVARHVVGNQPIMALFFFVFLFLSTFGLLNVVVGVIVERVLTISQNNKERQKTRQSRGKKQEVETLQDIFRMADLNHDLLLQQHELESAAEDPQVAMRLREHDLEVDEILPLFADLHSPGGKRALTMREFIQGISKLKGVATSKDLLALQAQSESLSDKMQALFHEIRRSEAMMTELDEVSLRIKQRFIYAVEGSRRKIAHQKGGAEPVVPPKRARPGAQENVDLSIGNRPTLPKFPSLLN